MIVRMYLFAGLLTCAAPAQAQQSDAIGRIVGAVGAIMADGKMRREIAAVSQPLSYDSDVPQLDVADVTDPRVVDVAGLKLGMSPAEARGALQRSGFSVNEEHRQYSFAMRVFPQSNANMVQDPEHWGVVGRNGQGITVKFAALPQGAVVDSIEYGVSRDAITEDAFVAQLGSKYGEADLAEDGRLIWCVGSAGKCPSDHAWQSQPHLIAEPAFRNLQLKFIDPARDKALEARVEAVLEGQKPKMEKADF